MLRDESEVALNDLIKLADTAAETYETAARVVLDHEADLAALFDELGEQRRGMEGELRAFDLSLGDLPHDADADYATVHDLYVRLRGLFSSDERRALVEECEAADQGLANGLLTALRLPLPEPMAATLKRYQYEVTAAIGRLAAARMRL
jgi:uncharacterized protein (TIGR02284 family)